MYENRTYSKEERRKAARDADLFLGMFIAGPIGSKPEHAAMSLYDLAWAAYLIITFLKAGASDIQSARRSLEDLLYQCEDLMERHYPLFADPAFVKKGFEALRLIVTKGGGENPRDAYIAATWLRNTLHNTYLEAEMRRIKIGSAPCCPRAAQPKRAQKDADGSGPNSVFS